MQFMASIAKPCQICHFTLKLSDVLTKYITPYFSETRCKTRFLLEEKEEVKLLDIKIFLR